MGSHMEEDILEKDFRMLTSLGCGSFGEVKLACHLPTHTRVAVKVLEKNTNSVADISTEVNILQSLEHRNIVRFFDMIDTLTTTYLIMEYVAGEDLESCLGALGYLKEEEARVIFRQVVSAVHFLHQRHIAHRDIKLENILVDAAGNAKLCDFGMAIEVTEGQMLEEICGSLLYWAPEILARKPYDGLAGDMWSLGIVLYVLVTGHFPYMEETLEGMHRVITTTMCPIPYHLSKPCHIIIARLLMIPTWYRFTICQLVEQPWLGPIQQHVLPTTKEILPRVVETMCTIGYTCEEIVSSLIHSREDNHVMATCNILKYQLSGGDSHQQDQMPWLTSSPAGPVHFPLPLPRRASEPAFTTGTEARKSHLKVEVVEERDNTCRSYSMPYRLSFLEAMPCSDNTVPKRDDLMADVINTAAENIAVNRNSVDSLPGNLSFPESVLDATPIGFLNLGFSEEDSFQGPDIPSDQPQVAATTAGSRPFRVWKLLRKQMSHALRALCCCCCCLPTPSVEIEMAQKNSRPGEE
ncbi:putative sperm motility kinase W [Peromyscus maniculatus bairdii]|uniref:putative sperm motility kinase W n=1 Tax=Peromyscus maniculatus bairdii TaxID=230844 RepID=UPI001C2DF492|nr:putative sperm motility kinase W [Peromyscus maniculatus bairdii]XP_042124188.1 putative sperm motility kinase W [Peromyscus maniculatus bairdii]XP_042124189.1 putative sperm motility kinase W [Peromyscus maniculatus bairdii]XP_042124190.1 putative sperm motility kinase W [Peromyscus maniculatus bairdii]XP_042124191.1 putative sperm motility kinase W [Peromyscus maniculatus bairdii]XP_042124192.1 putative sperm motility kinase W [Peromyscus maniculatus bairdii]